MSLSAIENAAIGKRIMPDAFGQVVQRVFQRAADLGTPILQRMGSTVLILCLKKTNRAG